MVHRVYCRKCLTLSNKALQYIPLDAHSNVVGRHKLIVK